MISIKINWETPQHQKESTWENGWSCESNLGANAAVAKQGTKWYETSTSDQIVSFVEFAFTARSVSQN